MKYSRIFLTVFCFSCLVQLSRAQYVGIGTTNPSALLDVAGDIMINGLVAGRGGGNIQFNAAMGKYGLETNSSGIRNCAFGFSTLRFNTTGSGNVGVGSFTLLNNASGVNNTGIGDDVLNANTTGSENTAAGHGALYLNTTGAHNTALGALAGIANVSGSNNTFIGVHANPATNALTNATAIGFRSFVGASNSLVLGSISGVNGATANTKVGIGTTTPAALLDVNGDIHIHGITIGRGLGSQQLNTAMGQLCMTTNTSGQRNSAFGYGTLRVNTTGSYNVAVGTYTLWNNTTGHHNTGVGDDVLNGNTTGFSNSAFGAAALNNTTTGAHNCAMGLQAGLANTTGYDNLFLGANANAGSGNLNNASAIGSRAMVSASNSMVLGSINGVNGATVNTKVGIGTTSPVASLHVEGTMKVSAWHSASMTANGHAEMGGVRMQWGSVSYTSNDVATITFPVPFNTLYSVTATVDAGSNTGSGANVPVKVMNVTATSFQIAGTQAFVGDTISKVRWMAVGN